MKNVASVEQMLMKKNILTLFSYKACKSCKDVLRARKKCNLKLFVRLFFNSSYFALFTRLVRTVRFLRFKARLTRYPHARSSRSIREDSWSSIIMVCRLTIIAMVKGSDFT